MIFVGHQFIEIFNDLVISLGRSVCSNLDRRLWIINGGERNFLRSEKLYRIQSQQNYGDASKRNWTPMAQKPCKHARSFLTGRTNLAQHVAGKIGRNRGRFRFVQQLP